jgi:transposase InsO family protein
VEIQCKVLEVSRAGFYNWLASKDSEPKPAQAKREAILNGIQAIHERPRQDTFGSPRVHQELLKQGINCAKNTVAKIMRDASIRARPHRKFRIATTDSNHELPIAPNRLEQNFVAEQPNQIWLTDFTYIHTREGFSYLCAVQDLYSRRIVGWATSRSIDADLAVAALNQAIALRNPAPGLIVHSDRGVQFASLAYRNRLENKGLLQSMSRKGNCYDNAPMESFFKSFKVEEVYEQDYQTHEHATRGAIDYIERFYNRTRLHSSLDYASPIEFEGRPVLST